MTIEHGIEIDPINCPGVDVGGTDAADLPADHPRSAANIERRRSLGLVERDEAGRLLPGSKIAVSRPNKGNTVTVLARTYTDKAVGLLGAVMDNDKAPLAVRVTAAQALLDRGWGKAPIQIDLNVRAKFDDFLRDVGIAAVYEREHPQHAQDITDVAIKAALDDPGPNSDEQEPGE